MNDYVCGFGMIGKLEMNIAYSSNMEFEYLQQFGRCCSMNAVKNLCETFLHKMGFSAYTISRLDSQQLPETQINSVRDDMLDCYFKGGFYPYDYLVSVLKTHSQEEPFYRQHVLSHFDNSQFSSEYAEQNMEITRLFSSHGYTEVAIITDFTHNKQNKIVLSLVAENVERPEFILLVEKWKNNLRALLKALDYTATKKFAEHWIPECEIKDVKITPKPLELIRLMVHQDLSMREAAHQLGKSENSCKIQMADIKKRLEVSTIHAAAYQLTKLKLIQ